MRSGESTVHGRGVFATEPIAAGTLVDASPVLVIPSDDWEALTGTAVDGYLWGWGEEGNAAIAFGIVSLVNHSYAPNCRYQHDLDAEVVELLALRDIAVGEELTVNYNGDPDGADPLWFDVSG